MMPCLSAATPTRMLQISNMHSAYRLITPSTAYSGMSFQRLSFLEVLKTLLVWSSLDWVVFRVLHHTHSSMRHRAKALPQQQCILRLGTTELSFHHLHLTLCQSQLTSAGHLECQTAMHARFCHICNLTSCNNTMSKTVCLVGPCKHEQAAFGGKGNCTWNC